MLSTELETDEALLVPKSRAALERYGHQVVISNLLNTRKQSVSLITKTNTENIYITAQQLADGHEIEQRIIEKLINIHQNIIGIN